MIKCKGAKMTIGQQQLEAKPTIGDVKAFTRVALRAAVEARAPLGVIDALLDTLRALDEPELRQGEAK